MSPELLMFGLGFVVGAGVAFAAMFIAVVIVGLGLHVEDFLSMESDPSLLAALGAMVAVFLFVLVATQTDYLNGYCVVRAGMTCWPGGN